MVKRRKLGATGLEVSEIGFGALEIGRDWAPEVNDDCTHCSEADAAHVLNGLLDLGINFVDTAPAYWKSEEFIGKAISPRRDEYVLATKVGERWEPGNSVYDYSRDATLRFIDESLAKLRTDRIDLLQIHSASMDVLERGETWQAIDEARRAGKVRFIGMSGGVDECVRALEIGGYETVQFPYNLLNVQAEARLLPMAREKNVGCIIMRGLAGGKLSPKFEKLQDEELKTVIRNFTSVCKTSAANTDQCDLVELALGYVLSAPEVSSVIVGTRKLATVKANLAASKNALEEAVLEQVRTMARKVTVRAW
jgi:aryl-alcohol dehydrogenase-like predicted oxidoreductase